METGRLRDGDPSPIVVEKPEGRGRFVIVCDHASNLIPEDYKSFGFPVDALQTHIAWDPGALKVAQHLSARLDAPLIWPDVSRLIIDCNRAPDARSLIVVESEGRKIDANRALTPAERSRRITRIHAPYHLAIDARLARRKAARLPTAVVAIHSFTPVYLGKARPWQVGLVFDHDRRLADSVIRGLKTDPTLNIGINEPYAPADQVYYTVSRHAGPRGLPAVMIEIRNDEIADEAGQRAWADRLAKLLGAAESSMAHASHIAGVKLAL